MIRDVINVFENLVNNVQYVGGFIGESLYWMPISVEGIKRIIGIVIIVGILVMLIDRLFLREDEKEHVSISLVYWGTTLAFGSSVIGLSLFYSCFGAIAEKDLSFMLASTLGVAGILALEVGVVTFFSPENFILGAFAFLLAIPLWLAFALGFLLIYSFIQGEVMPVLAFLFLLGIFGAIFGGEEYVVVLIIND